MTTAPTRHEQRRRRGARFGFLARRYGKLAGLFLGSLLAAWLLAAVLDGIGPVALLPKLAGRGSEPLAEAAGAVVAGWAGLWAILAVVFIARRLFRLGGGALAIAGVTLDEALRARVVAFGAVLLVVLVAGLPTMIQDAQPLRYQIQSYLNYSQFLLGAVAGLVVTLFAVFAAATDVEDQRAADVFVKPLPRWAYLLGRWLGITTLGVSLVAGATVMIAFTANVTLGSAASIDRRGFDDYDRRAIRNQVFTARGRAPAQPVRPLAEVAADAWQQLAQQDPSLFQRYVRESGGDEGAALNRYYAEVVLPTWSEVPPGEARPYVFTGLADAKRRAEAAADGEGETATVQLRYKVKTPSLGKGDELTMLLVIGGRASPFVAPVDQTSIYNVNTDYITDDGELQVVFQNAVPTQAGLLAPRYTVKFEPDEGTAPLEVLYRVGGFGQNLLLGAWVGVVRLAFLAMLGTVTGALMSLPVAGMVTLAFWLLAALGSAISGAVGAAGGLTEVAVVDQTWRGLLGLVESAAGLLRLFSEPGVGALLADGQWLGAGPVLSTSLWVGLVWTLAALLIGWLLFSRRELARVQV